jgi:predicted aconitase with swiveling domain
VANVTGRVIAGEPLVPGTASGPALVATEPLSFWGGYDPTSGSIIDRRHPLFGLVAAGRVLAVPFSRGSSTTAAVLLEAIRMRTAPAAIVTTGRDAFFALASIVAQELYDRAVPVVVIATSDFHELASGDMLSILVDGSIEIMPSLPPPMASG